MLWQLIILLALAAGSVAHAQHQAAPSPSAPASPNGEAVRGAHLPPGVHGPVRDGPSPQDVFLAAMDHLGGRGEAWRDRHAGMVETESSWRVGAESPWAQGIAQFTAPTRGDVWPNVAGCGGADPFDPWCGVLAMDLYMQGLYRRSLALAEDRRTALRIARAAYNGGLGWQQRQHRLCLTTPGCDPDNWEHLAALCREAGRSEASCRENNSYPGKVARAEAGHRKKRGLGRKILRGVAIGASVAQGRVPDLR
ncbi:MAG: hypothetical protein OXI22_00830 [Defluviicoccus sp.]|nr:hypothetical protein [Defluviicoccus sp.]